MIDGSKGEGGGQVLRSALSLSLLTGRPFHLFQIRAGRDKPGLRPQHLAAVQAAAQVSGARVTGDRVGSSEIDFAPGTVRPGDYVFDIGSAGSTSLVLQTLLLPLAVASEASRLTIRGGTHVPWSPCFHYLDWQWRPFLGRMGITFDLSMTIAGFYPRGGGELRARIPGGARPMTLHLTERGEIRRIRGVSGVANLPLAIAERQRDQALRRLKSILPRPTPELELVEFPACSRGTVLVLLAECEVGQGCCFALGARGKRAEQVADEAAQSLSDFLCSGGAVDQWLADQLLLPLAIAGGRSVLSTSRITSHLITNAAVIRLFLPVEIRLGGPVGSPATVRLEPASEGCRWLQP